MLLINYLKMKIAILEICASTHYTLLNALIKTYCTDSHNTIVVYTLDNIAKSLKDGGIPDRTKVVVLNPHDNIGQFLKNIENTPFDRLHICTIENYYREFSQFNPKIKVAKTKQFLSPNIQIPPIDCDPFPIYEDFAKPIRMHRHNRFW